MTHPIFCCMVLMTLISRLAKVSKQNMQNVLALFYFCSIHTGLNERSDIVVYKRFARTSKLSVLLDKVKCVFRQSWLYKFSVKQSSATVALKTSQMLLFLFSKVHASYTRLVIFKSLVLGNAFLLRVYKSFVRAVNMLLNKGLYTTLLEVCGCYVF